MLPKPPNGYLDRPKAEDLLTRYVFATLKEGPVALPKRAEPAQVDDFLSKSLDAEALTSRQVSKAGDLMRFFDLRGRASQLTKWLKRQERERDEVLRSMSSIAILGDLGDDALRQQAADYYGFLASRDVASPLYEQLVDLFFYLPEKADPQWIVGPLDRKAKTFESKAAAGDIDAEAAFKRLQKLKESRLGRILAAKKRKHEILGSADANRRRQEMVRCYLRLELHAHVDLRGWAAAELQHDCNSTRPADLANAFAHMLDLLRMPASVPGPGGQRLAPEDEKACVTSCARAVAFYLGALTQEQADFVRAHENSKQSDILYWEP